MQIDEADRSTPSAIRSELGRYGGLNPFNRANWRIVLAEDRLVLRGGVFKHMPVGNKMKVIDIVPIIHPVTKQKVWQYIHSEVKPDKVLTGWHRVPKYAVKGWILERWFDSSFYNRDQWESARSEDGTPMMGPYPAEGEYFMLAGPWEKMPEMHDLKMAISMHIREEEARPASYKQMLLQEIHEDEEAERKAYDLAMSNLAHFYESEVEPVMKGSSLEASRIRQDLARATGDFSHQGIA